ncbi:hypothetical protein TARUN_1755 [Trichoderma arundinaceum]|uniref:Uncharacterized protein n=1 Tax=Trichoderma arundinaceum TaxID=490622 RepID=A0A395NWD5_TRIAR|nr:hypothetical protein TARUN_1755 [Trichoderma arundinaceum]
MDKIAACSGPLNRTSFTATRGDVRCYPWHRWVSTVELAHWDHHAQTVEASWTGSQDYYRMHARCSAHTYAQIKKPAPVPNGANSFPFLAQVVTQRLCKERRNQFRDAMASLPLGLVVSPQAARRPQLGQSLGMSLYMSTRATTLRAATNDGSPRSFQYILEGQHPGIKVSAKLQPDSPPVREAYRSPPYAATPNPCQMAASQRLGLPDRSVAVLDIKRAAV